MSVRTRQAIMLIGMVIVVALLYTFLFIPNYNECRHRGFSKPYCARTLLR